MPASDSVFLIIFFIFSQVYNIGCKTIPYVLNSVDTNIVLYKVSSMYQSSAHIFFCQNFIGFLKKIIITISITIITIIKKNILSLILIIMITVIEVE